MNEKVMKPTSRDEIRHTDGKTNWDHLRAAGDFEGPDEDDVDLDWAGAVMIHPKPKKLISMRVDAEVLEFFRQQGKGYQTRMNAVLRAYMDAQQKAG